VPVKGKVTLDGKPYTGGGTVVFHPTKAAAAGEKVYAPTSPIDENGNYELKTSGQPGAPEGTYKAVISPNMADPMKMKPGGKGAFDFQKYGSAKTTPLPTIQVVAGADPAAYELKLKKASE